MSKIKAKSSPNSNKDIRPAINPDNAENQCIALAMDLVRQRLINGTASSQETTHFLRAGSREAQLKREILELEKELTIAKTEKIKSEEKMESLYAEAIKAMRDYGGQGDPDEY